MSSTTVAEFANELKKTPETLLDQLKSAGVPKQAVTDALSEADKQRLLGFLKASHGTVEPERKKITLTKKSTSEIKQADATGRARTIQVEVRKKRTFIQRDEGHPAVSEATAAAEAEAPVAAAPAAPQIDEAELARREEDARRQAELIRRQEEELVEKRRLREEAEAREREKVERAEQAEQAEQAAKAARKKAAEAATPVTEGAPEAPEEAPAVTDRKVAAEAAAAQAKDDAKAKAAAESKARADEEAARAKDLDERRRKALAEAEAIRAMMNAPARVLVPHKAPEKPAPEKAAVKGTLHKPTAPPARPGAPAAPGAAAAPGAGKEVKSAKLSSSWAGDTAKKKEIKTRGDASGGVGRGNWRGGPRGRRGNDRGGHDEQHVPAAPVEARVLEVHVPETITVAELAHKMAVKAQEVIKQLMKLGQMATINQSLDQDTAMILVEEMGHNAVVAALDDPEAFITEEASAQTAEALPR